MSPPTCLGRRVTVLLTSVGNEAIHGFVEDLRRRAPRWILVGVDVRNDAAGLFRCDLARIVPRRDDPAFLPTLRELCDALKVDVILPLSTRDQDTFSDPVVQAALGGRPVVVSSPDAVARANSKIGLWNALETVPWLRGEGIVASNPAEGLAASKELLGRHGAVVIKEDLGTGGSGMVFVGDPGVDSAPAEGRRFVSPVELPAVLRFSDGSPRGQWPRLICAWLPGREYSVDVLADRGRVLASVVRHRLAAVGGLATVARTVDEPELDRAAAQVVETLGLSYVNNVQFRRDASGQPRILEVNPRIPGTISLTVEAGLNLPLAACALALGETLPLPVPEQGILVSRFSGSAFTRTRASAPQTLSPELPTPCAILVDLDGTLVHLRIPKEAIASWKRHLRARLEPVLGPNSLSPFLPTLESALARLPELLGPAAALQLRRELFEELDIAELAACTTIDPIDPAIAAILDLPGPKALVTNNGPRTAQRALEVVEAAARRLGRELPPFVVVHRSPDFPAKPAATPLIVAIDRLARAGDTPWRAALMVGDSDHDEQAALALRARVHHPVVFARVGPDGVVRLPVLGAVRP